MNEEEKPVNEPVTKKPKLVKIVNYGDTALAVIFGAFVIGCCTYGGITCAGERIERRLGGQSNDYLEDISRALREKNLSCPRCPNNREPLVQILEELQRQRIGYQPQNCRTEELFGNPDQPETFCDINGKRSFVTIDGLPVQDYFKE